MIRQDKQETKCYVMQEKWPVMLTCRFGVVIVDDEFTWGHVRQTVLLQGKVPGDRLARNVHRQFILKRLDAGWRTAFGNTAEM